MKLASIKIKNVLGVRAADITLDRSVALIAGANYAGKSSVQEAVRMALTGETVRVDLKKDYGQLVTEGQSSGIVEIGIADGPVAWFQLPDGKATPVTEYVAPPALPYILDAQRFARLPDNDRRSFLFGLMGLSAGGAVVREKLVARGCDATKIEAAMPLLRAGFAAACDEAKAKARDAKAAWRTVTGETYGEKKAAGWRAQVPAYDSGVLAKTRTELAAVEAEIEAEAAALGDLSGRAKQAEEQRAKLSGLRNTASTFARIQEKLNRDEKDRDDWRSKVSETRAKAGGVPAAETPLNCPHCAGVVIYANHALHAYEPPVFDAEAAAKLPEYEKALELLERSVANDQRDLAAADEAAKSIKALEDAGLVEAPDQQALTDSQARLSALRQRKAALGAEISNHEAGERAAAEAGRKTEAAAIHHADVESWVKIADALAPDGIPGEMLSAALKPINDRLQQSSADAQWPLVMIADDMAIRVWPRTEVPETGFYRPYPLLSESEKWRVDAMIAEAIAFLSGIKLLVLDRFDVLDLQGRADLLEWLNILAKNGEIDTALIFGTLKALPAQLPETVGAHWIENGVLGGMKVAA